MSNESDYRADWLECSLDAVMKYFAEGFKPEDGREIWNYTWFIDQTKGKVVFRLDTRREG